MIRTVGLWGPVILVMAVIFCISSLPDAPLPEGMSDKTGHTLGYTLLYLSLVVLITLTFALVLWWVWRKLFGRGKPAAGNGSSGYGTA